MRRRSPDEGKTWGIIAGVPLGEALVVIEHPYDSKIVRNPPSSLHLNTN